MADSSAGGWGSVVLPSAFPQVGQIAEQGLANQRMRDDKVLALAEREQLRKEEQNKQNQLYNLGQINKATDFDQFKTGDAAIDEVAYKKVNDLKNDLLTNHTHENPTVLAAMIPQRLNPIMQWHLAALNENKNAQNAISTLVKENPIDPIATHNLVMSNLARNVMQPDPKTGAMDIKPAQFIAPMDYSGILNNPRVMAGLVNSTEHLNKFYSSVPKEPFHGSEFQSDKGFKSRDKFSGAIVPGITDVLPDENGNPILDVKHTIVPGVKDKNNQPMKIVDNNLYTKLMGTEQPVIANNGTKTNISPAGLSALKLWYNSDDRAKAEADYQKNNNGKPLDPHTEDYLFRHFLYNNISANVPHFISKDEAQVVPKAPIVNVNTGKEVPTQDVYTPLSKAMNEHPAGATLNILPPAVRDFFMNELSKSNQTKIVKNIDGQDRTIELGSDNFAVKANKDGTYDLYSTKYKYPIKNGKEDLTANGERIPDKILGTYNATDLNLGVAKGKERGQVLKNANTYIVNGKNMTHDELKNAGYTDDQINQAIQLGNIKRK